MPEIRAIRGLRYDLGHIGSLSEVICPPSDTISADLQDELYKRHPANAVRIVQNRVEPGDDSRDHSNARAARFLANWRKEKVLQREPDPAIYVYHQQFERDGKTYTRRGMITGIALDVPGVDSFQTLQLERLNPVDPFDGRPQLVKATRTNVAPVVGLYDDPLDEVQSILDAAVATATPLEAHDDEGVKHRVWPVTDVNIISQVQQAIANLPMRITSGSEDFHAAWSYRQEVEQRGELTSAHPANVMLTALFEQSSEGLLTLPCHQLLRDAPSLSSHELIEKLGDAFDCRAMGQGPELASSLWEEIETSAQEGQFGIYCSLDETWVLVTLTAEGLDKFEKATPERTSDWRSLDAMILEWLLCLEQLELANSEPVFVHHLPRLIEELKLDRDTPETFFPMAILIRPPLMVDIQNYTARGSVLPHGVQFFPSVLSGLVFNPLS